MSILDRADRCVDVTLFLLPLVLLVVCVLGAASTDMSKIIVDEEEETKDCFFTTVCGGKTAGIKSVLFSGMFSPPIDTEVFLDSVDAFTPAAASTTLAVDAAAEVVLRCDLMCITESNKSGNIAFQLLC